MSKPFGAFSKDQRHNLIEESLDLIVSYFGHDSDIFVYTSDRSIGYEPSAQSFQYFQTRFILAKWIEFKEIIDSVDSILSSSYEPIKQEFVGKIQGTLLISEYVSKKWNNSLEKRYPCLISSENWDTPENAFILHILNLIYNRLRVLPLPKTSGEYSFQQKALTECYNMLQHPIFSIVKASAFYNMKLSQLFEMMKTRNRRGQTGDVKKFGHLIKWFKSLSWSALLDDSPENLELVFGSNPNTWDKFFEVWILAKLLEALLNHSNELVGSVELIMAPLEQRLSGPIAILKSNDFELEVYFQNPVLLKSRWKYEDGNNLRGIPDIILSAKGCPNILAMIDVKNIMYETRKDANTEKYKMLGYFESFRDSIEHQPIGILILRNDVSYRFDHLCTEQNAKLSLFTVSPRYSLEAFSVIAAQLWQVVKDPPVITTIDFEHEEEQTLIVMGEAAHNKAKELALQKPEELMRCKNELQRYIFPTTWKHIPSECQTLLGMAELLFQNLQEQCGIDPDVDWGPVILEYCRAVEYYFNHEIIIPFRRSDHFKQIKKTSRGFELRAYMYLNDKDTLMLGEMARFFNDIKNSTEGIFTYISQKDYLNTDINFWKRSLSKNLFEINKNYRRGAAHIKLLSLADVNNCRLRIIGSAETKGLFPNLFHVQ